MTILAEALSRVEEYRTSDRLTRRAWAGVKNGRSTACLLAALSPEAAAALSATACPADLLDPWFAHLTVWFDDAGSLEAWPSMVARYGGLVRKLMSLPPERRIRIEYASRAIIVREAMRHTTDPGALGACERVIALCDGVAAGQPRDDAAFGAAADTAISMAMPRVMATGWTAAAAVTADGWAPLAKTAASRTAWSADAAVRAAAMAARAAAAASDIAAAARAATNSADAAEWAAAAASSEVPKAITGYVAGSAAADRMTTAIFDLIKGAS